MISSVLKTVILSGDRQQIGIQAVALVSLLLAIALSCVDPEIFRETNIADIEFYTTSCFCIALLFMLLSAAWLHQSVISPYGLFLFTSCLFLGGRFIAHVAGYRSGIFSESHFGPIDLSSPEAWRLTSLVMTCFLSIHAGYFLTWSYVGRPRSDVSPVVENSNDLYAVPALILLCICFPAGLLGMIQQYSSHSEYTDLYKSGSDFSTRLIPLANYGLLLALGLSFVTRKRRLQLLITLATGIFCILYLGLGVRTALLSYILLVVWLFHNTVRPLPSAIIIITSVLMFVAAQSVWAFSTRGQNNSFSFEERFHQLQLAISPSEMLRFAHYQGVSLLSISLADSISDYPRPAFFQTFVPGFGAAAALLKRPFELSDLYFSIYLTKTALPSNYAKNETIGWSIVSDMLVFSNKSQALFLFLSLLFGVGLATLTYWSTRDAIWFGVFVVIFPKLMILPRAGMYSIVPYIIAYFIIIYLSKYAQRLIAWSRG